MDDDARKLLGYIDDSASAVGLVADGLHRYAEICGRPLRPEPLDLNLALESAMANLRAQIESTATEITSTALPRVEADPAAMAWLFQELLTNAIRFRASAVTPRVNVKSGAGGPAKWFVSVLDNGPGIESGMEERIFRPFKKLAAGQGAGLGLTLCRRIVEMHSGRLWVEPGSGGAEFRFFVNEGPA